MFCYVLENKSNNKYLLLTSKQKCDLTEVNWKRPPFWFVTKPQNNFGMNFINKLGLEVVTVKFYWAVIKWYIWCVFWIKCTFFWWENNWRQENWVGGNKISCKSQLYFFFGMPLIRVGGIVNQENKKCWPNIITDHAAER